jgi:hypothetical protein
MTSAVRSYPSRNFQESEKDESREIIAITAGGFYQESTIKANKIITTLFRACKDGYRKVRISLNNFDK